jgi:diamine N-acetyltransferase
MSPVRSNLHVAVRFGTTADARALAAFAAQAFLDTFGADNRPDDMAVYLRAAFGEPQQRAELTDPACTVLLAEERGALIGYAMLRDGAAPSEVGSNALEIARLYAGQRWIGAGVGTALMQRCLSEAASRERERTWLGVWERNARAIAFYSRWGFTDVGAQQCQLGTDLQTDRILTRSVVMKE